MRAHSLVFGYCFALLTVLSSAAVASPMDVILQDLKSRIETTRAPFYTYSYAKAKDVGVAPNEAVDISDGNVQKFLTTKANEYFDLSKAPSSGTMPGFYLALDPIVSREYGGDGSEWVLYRIEIPKGFRFLDASIARRGGWEGSKLPDSIVQSLKALGCEPNALDAENFTYQHLFQYNEGDNCRKVVHQILDQLGVDMIEYRWTAVEIPGCTWSEDDSFDERAIILLHPEKLPRRSMRVFTSNTPDTSEDRTEKRRLDELMRLVKAPPSRSLWSKYTRIADPSELQSWTQRHLLNCRQ